ncbi:MAG TPA: DUF5069 domain-containing protein [Verrucomicrobia bacterium]|nr:DUF5069 domain-containing protein [Verrucomicrobiota bacterium]HOP98545.1 DUF5069 domain-containing protein [Verrucomicrobiota bacterium]HPU55586.1 DUF5069 domain-containing protein [Verrucomicrobiota bacterium]
MSEIIYPRSPRETMCGWMHLPRYIDKIRLHLAGKLHPDYQPNFGKGFDGLWLEMAGVKEQEFIEVVRNSITDGQVCDWVLKNVRKPDSVKEEHRRRMLDYPSKDDVAGQERLKMRKKQSGLEHRDDIQCFVDYIDADEKRI